MAFAEACQRELCCWCNLLGKHDRPKQQYVSSREAATHRVQEVRVGQVLKERAKALVEGLPDQAQTFKSMTCTRQMGRKRQTTTG